MRKSYATLLLAVISAVAATVADNSLGTWKLNAEKSKYSPGSLPVQSLTSVREESDNGVKVTNTGVRADGTPVNVSYIAKYGGSDSLVTGTGAPYDTIWIKQVNANTFTEDRRKTGTMYHASGRTIISRDGKTLTYSAKGTDAQGKPFTITLVFDKQ